MIQDGAVRLVCYGRSQERREQVIDFYLGEYCGEEIKSLYRCKVVFGKQGTRIVSGRMGVFFFFSWGSSPAVLVCILGGELVCFVAVSCPAFF